MKTELPTAVDLRNQYGQHDCDGDVLWVMHVNSVSRLIQYYYRKGVEEGREELLRQQLREERETEGL